MENSTQSSRRERETANDPFRADEIDLLDQKAPEKSSEKESARQTILMIAAQEIHKNGFRATGLNDILKQTGLTKGAFYYHFKSKAELGRAVAEEIIDKMIREMWMRPLEKEGAGLSTLQSILDYAMAANNKKIVSLGCPLCNMAQEMATQDEAICAVLRRTIDDWRARVSSALKNDQIKGLIKKTVDCDQSALFFLSSLQGAIGIAKPYHDPAPFRSSLRCLRDYLDSLRATTIQQAAGAA
ncbi:MAG: TetR/AcrR family transcriptional regulator [bacterium]